MHLDPRAPWILSSVELLFRGLHPVLDVQILSVSLSGPRLFFGLVYRFSVSVPCADRSFFDSTFSAHVQFTFILDALLFIVSFPASCLL